MSWYGGCCLWRIRIDLYDLTSLHIHGSGWSMIFLGPQFSVWTIPPFVFTTWIFRWFFLASLFSSKCLHLTSWCFQAPKKYPTCKEFFHQRETSKMSIQGWKAPFMAIVICLDTLIFLKILSTFVDGVVGQMTIDICQMLLEHGNIKAKDSLLYLGVVPHDASGHQASQGYSVPRIHRTISKIQPLGQLPDNTFWNDFSDSIDSGTLEVVNSPPKKYQNSNFTRFQFESFYCTIKWTVPKITPHSQER